MISTPRTASISNGQASGGARRAADTSADPRTLWEALTNDSDANVMVVSTNGAVEYMNPSLSRAVGYPASGQVSAKLEDVYGSAFADERLAYLKDAHREGRTVTVVGMLRGVLMRSVYRPLPDDGSGVGRVLSVCRPATVTAAEDGVIRAKGDDSGRLGTLTSREMDILKLIGQGLSTAEIAKKLHRSVKTVEWHRVSLGNKLGVTNRVELARIAIASGIVTVGMSDVNGLAQERAAR